MTKRRRTVQGDLAAMRACFAKQERAAKKPRAKCGSTEAHGAHTFDRTWCAGNVDLVE